MTEAANLVNSAKGVSKIALWILAIDAIKDGIKALIAWQFSVPNQPRDAQSASVMPLIDLVLLVASGIMILMWVFRTVKAAAAMSRVRFPYTPGMAVAYYFIPLLNIYRPFQMMMLTLNWSAPAGKRISILTKLVVWIWWLSWIVSGVFEFYSSPNADSIGIAVGSLISVLSALALIYIVREMTRLQDGLLVEWERDANVSPPPVTGAAKYPRPQGQETTA